LHEVVVRTLSRELRLHTDDERAFAQLSYAGADPAMPPGERMPVDLVVQRIGESYRIEPPDGDSVDGSIDTVLTGVFRLLGSWFVDEAGNRPVIHAAIAVMEGQRFAFLGDKGAGKTTLMLKLIAEGFGVEGDEHAVLSEKGVIVRPRRLHVKESSLALFPELSAAIRNSPWAADWRGSRVFACPPSLCGAQWVIRDCPVEHLVFVESNFGGKSILAPLSGDAAFARLLETAFLPTTNRGAAAAKLRMLGAHASAWHLLAGDLNDAIWQLQKNALR